MEFNLIQDNFRRIKGLGTLISQLKRSNNNMNLKISILNCMYKLIQKSEIVYDFKVFGIVPLLQNILKEGKNFMEISLTINILSLLLFDQDLCLKIMDNGLSNITQFLIDCHPNNRHKLVFSDIKQELLSEAILELELHCFRLLRFLFSIEKNRKVFKLLFPPKVFGIFIDIGNYVKNYNKYRTLAEAFNKLPE